MLSLSPVCRPSARTAILTASGFVIDLAAPDATGLPIEDLARALAYQPRWCGATSSFYSVAEHSVFVSSIVDHSIAYFALLHDLVEGITGDLPTPLKVVLGRDHINDRLLPLERAFQRQFGYQVNLPAIKHADLVAMATELRDLLPPAWMDWSHLPPAHSAQIVPIGPERAYRLFLDRYHELRHQAVGIAA